MFWSLLLLLTPTLDERAATFRAWRENEHHFIRVGLQKPSRTPQFSANAPLLVLDGDRPVSIIEPKGPFWVIQENEASDRALFVQLQASRSQQYLKTTQMRLSPKVSPNMEFKIENSENSALKVLRVGPFSELEEAENFCQSAKDWGIPDAFPVIRQQKWPFAWVDQNFNKSLIEAASPAFVQLDPQQPIRLEGKGYRGILRLRDTGNGIRVINELPLEIYLLGVVPAELGPNVFPEPEAIRAQAIAARTYALKNLNGYPKEGFDICDGPACQAYGGADVEHPMSDEAVFSTRSMVLTYQGELINALYTSTAGDSTEDVGLVFPGRQEDYLKGKPSPTAQFQSFRLPERAQPPIPDDPQHADLAVRALLCGLETLPDLEGSLTASDLTLWLGQFPLFPALFDQKGDGKVSYRRFFDSLAKHPLVLDSESTLFRKEDHARALQLAPLESDPLSAFLIRFQILGSAWLKNRFSDKPISKATAMAILVDWSETLGPSPNWERATLLSNEDNQLHVRLSASKEADWDLTPVKTYLVREADSWSWVSQPQLDSLDRVVRCPDRPDLLWIELNGSVAVVDRVGKYATWSDRKTVEELEQQARQYLPQIRGVRDIRIAERAPSGRVTALEWIADSGNTTVNGLRIRWSLGIRDNLFDMFPIYKDGRLQFVSFIGRGWGHGVGMSQVGAYALGRMGLRYDQILQHYYHGAEISQIPD